MQSVPVARLILRNVLVAHLIRNMQLRIVFVAGVTVRNVLVAGLISRNVLVALLIVRNGSAMETRVCAEWLLISSGDTGVCWVGADQQWRHGCVLGGCWLAMEMECVLGGC